MFIPMWLIVLLVAFLGWRVYRRQRQLAAFRACYFEFSDWAIERLRRAQTHIYLFDHASLAQSLTELETDWDRILTRHRAAVRREGTTW
jgi:hypothetical protein